jgi:hypothetical protein
MALEAFLRLPRKFCLQFGITNERHNSNGNGSSRWLLRLLRRKLKKNDAA